MRSRWIVWLLSILLIGGTTAAGIAAKTFKPGGDAAVAQYGPGTPNSPGEGNKQKKICRTLARDHRRYEAGLHRRHKLLLRKLHGGLRRRLARYFRSEERRTHAQNIKVERRCRKG
jgi:hypothetical protein